MPGFILNAINTFAQSLLDTFLTGVWVASLAVLRAAFALVDVVSGFSLTFTAAGNPADAAAAAPAAGAGMAGVCQGGVAPVGGQCVLDATIAAPWQLLRTLSLVIAGGLFFWQLGSTMLRGGRGFFHTATGPLAYGIALAATGGLVAALLGAADAVSSALLGAGFGRVIGFAGVLDNPKFNGVFTATDAGQAALNGASAIALGLIAVFGVIPVALGYMGEMVFREGAILVLVATIPITAAGLVAQTSSSWFWRALRWIIAAILMKPALALVLVIGVSTLANPQGLGGLLAGVGLLLMALFCPYALFRLLSFVDPGTGAGASSRAWAASALASLSPGGGAGQVETGSGVAMAEAANTARFDQAGAGSSGSSGSSVGVGGGSGGGGGGSDATTPDASGAGSSSGGSGAGSSGGGSSGGGGLAARAGQAVGQGAAAVAAGAARVTNFANAQMAATGVGDPGGGTVQGGQGSPASSQSGNGPSGSGQSGSGPSGSGPSGGGDSPAGHGGDSPAGQDPSATVGAAGEPAPPAATPAGPGSGSSGTGGGGQDPPPATPPPGGSGPEGSGPPPPGPEGSGPEGSGPRPPTPPAGGGGGGHKPGGGSGGASAGEVEEAAVIA